MSRRRPIPRWGLWLLAGLLTALGVSGNPMLLIYPMWIITALARDPIQRLVRPLGAGAAFIGAGLVFGLLTELFAILNNLRRPPEARILLSPDPLHDLLFGVFYYLMLVATWYLLIRAFRYTKAEIFLITGLFGVMTEEVGQVFLRIFQTPVTGLLYAAIVATVYGIFPTLAAIVGEEKLPGPARSNGLVRFLVAALALFAQWAAYGLLVLPALKRLT